MEFMIDQHPVRTASLSNCISISRQLSRAKHPSSPDSSCSTTGRSSASESHWNCCSSSCEAWGSPKTTGMIESRSVWRWEILGKFPPGRKHNQHDFHGLIYCLINRDLKWDSTPICLEEAKSPGLRSLLTNLNTSTNSSRTDLAVQTSAYN